MTSALLAAPPAESCGVRFSRAWRVNALHATTSNPNNAAATGSCCRCGRTDANATALAAVAGADRCVDEVGENGICTRMSCVGGLDAHRKRD